VWTLEVVRTGDRCGNLQAQDAVLVIKIKHHSNVVTSPLLHRRGKYDEHLRAPGEIEA
jgi:hypothetical protein